MKSQTQKKAIGASWPTTKKPLPKPVPAPQPQPTHNYNVVFKSDDVYFELESTDKKFVEEKIDLFMLQDKDDPRLEDAMRMLDAMIDDIKSTPTE